MDQKMKTEDNKTLKSIALSIAALFAITVVLVICANVFF